MPDDSEKLEAVVCAAVEVASPEERADFIRQQCGSNEALCRQVEELVDAYLRSGDFLESPPAALSPSLEWELPEASGTVIGRYKLIEQIGEGGFGSVYLAEQFEPVRRLVALKIIKLGLDTRKVVARFEAERQALAMMEHPGIAKVLDAGATETGRPYFVMELVRGAPITAYCDAHRLSIRERLVLFEQVCQAVQHAHQKGIIHRDLKPTNVLVSGEEGQPVTKVIDFGVAKAIEGRLTEKTIFTEHQQLIGTPAYMSPEQADGTLDVDTRSDVYSLGVLLYELLTGTPPFDPQDLRSKAFAEMQRIIREVDPPTPSARLIEVAKTTTTNPSEPEPSTHNSLAQIADNRSVDPLRLSASLHGELDWIVMRCLEKDRARRYQAATNLADDVRRYLDDLPVEARPPTPLYRMGKFAQRNKGGVLAGAAIVAALIIGVALLTWLLVREREARRQATTAAAKSEQVSQFLKEMLAAAGPSVAQGRDATLIHEILAKTAQRVNAELGDLPDVRGDLFYTLGETYQDIGDYANAVPAFQQAVDSYRDAGAYSPALALSLARLGRCQSFNKDVASGKANAKLGLDIARTLDDPEVLATCLLSVASSFDLYGMGSAEGAPYIREAVELRRRLGKNSEDFADSLRLLASISEDPMEAESLHRQALELHRKQLGADHPKVASDLFSLGQKLMDSDKYEQAEPVLRETVDLYRKIYPVDHPYQVIVLRFLAATQIREGKWAEAESSIEEAIAKYPAISDYHGLLASFKAYQGKWSEAADQLPSSSNWDWQAFALVKAGRIEEYRSFRKAWKLDTVKLETEWRLNCAKMLLLLPADGFDLERAYKAADIDPASVSIQRNVYWLDVVKALAEYRRGNFELAFELADRAVARKDDTELSRLAQGWCIRALACTKLGKIDDGRASLASAEKLTNRPDRDSSTDFLFHWTDWAVAEILGREAAALIDQSPRDQTGHEKPAADQASPINTNK